MSVKPSVRNVAATAGYIIKFVRGLEEMGKPVPAGLSEMADTIETVLDTQNAKFADVKNFPLDSKERITWEDDTIKALIGTRDSSSGSIMVRAAKAIEAMPQNITVGYGVAANSRDSIVRDVKGCREMERQGSGRRDRGAYAHDPLWGMVKTIKPSVPAVIAQPLIASMPRPGPR